MGRAVYRPLEVRGTGRAAYGELTEEEDEESSDEEEDDEDADEQDGSDSDHSDPAAATEEGRLHSDFERVLMEEREAIEKDHRQRYAASDGTRFSVALSGGGIRATAFQTGVLWRLAEEGCLKDVEHISAVSGGSWAALGFASHVVNAGQPEAGCDLNAWYLDAVAKTICRMVNNAPYLARDMCKDPFSFPRDGSSTLPRICDIPILACTLLMSLMVRPIFHTALYLVPFVELVDILFGAQMREMFCWSDDWDKHWDRWPLRGLCSLPVEIFLCTSASVLLLRVASICKPFRRPGSKGWLFFQGSFSLLARVAAIMVVLVIVIGVTAFMETWAYSTKGVRREVCKHYISNVSLRLDCHDITLRSAVAWYHRLDVQRFYRDQWNVTSSRGRVPDWDRVFLNSTAAAAWNTALTIIHGPTVMWSLVDSLVPATLASLVVLLLLTLACVPINPNSFLQVLNVAGPLLVLSIVCSAVQWRVFGPITGQRFLSLDRLPFNNESWHFLYASSLLLTMAALPFYYFLRGNAHRFYRRSLRLAFFAGGKDLSWGDIRRSCYCPIVLVSATVTDYIIPGEKLPINPIFFSPLHFGGSGLGFVRMKPRSNVAKAMAMSGAAPDAVVLAKHHHLRSRFWLEVLGIGVGQHIQFDTIGNRRKVPHLRLCTGRLARRGEEVPDIFYRLPSVLLFEVHYGLLLVSELVFHQLQQCMAGRVIFYHGIGLAAILVILSFFAFLPQLDFLLHSAVIRTIHQVTGYYHQGRSPPSLLYVTDGMVEDNTGVMDLLRRRCERILLIYAGGDAKDEFKFLRKIVEAAAAAKLASIYDLEDPRNDVGVAVDRYRQMTGKRFLQLGVLYGWDGPPELRKSGRLLILKIHLPQALQDLPVQPVLTESEIRGEDAACASPTSGDDDLRPHKRARDLSGCCCDCCHGCGLKCGSMFPFPPTGMQFLTPQVTSSLCRLGHCVSQGVVDALRAPLKDAA